MKQLIVTVCAALLLPVLAHGSEKMGVYSTDGNALDLTPVDDLYDGTLGSMACLTLEVPDRAIIADIGVTIDIAHTGTGDLVIKLESPAGTVVDLVSRAGFDEPADDGTGCCGVTSDLVFGNEYRINDGFKRSSETAGDGGEDPIDSFDLYSSGFGNERGLSTMFDLEDAQGTWTLHVGDASAGEVGTLDGFSLGIQGCDPKSGDADGCGCVDFSDILAILGEWGNTGPPGIRGDATCDGLVSFQDIVLVLSTFISQACS